MVPAALLRPACSPARRRSETALGAIPRQRRGQGIAGVSTVQRTDCRVSRRHRYRGGCLRKSGRFSQTYTTYHLPVDPADREKAKRRAAKGVRPGPDCPLTAVTSTGTTFDGHCMRPTLVEGCTRGKVRDRSSDTHCSHSVSDSTHDSRRRHTAAPHRSGAPADEYPGSGG